MRRLVIAIGLTACVQPAPPAEPSSPRAEVTLDGCAAEVALAATPTGDAGVEADAPAPTGPDPQAYLDDALEPALIRNREAIASCLPRGLLVVDLAFAITSTGEIESILVEGSLGPSVQPCLAGILRGLALPGSGHAIEQARCRIRARWGAGPTP
jgi:hypothetical protein